MARIETSAKTSGFQNALIKTSREHVCILLDASGSMASQWGVGDLDQGLGSKSMTKMKPKYRAAIDAAQCIVDASSPATTTFSVIAFSDGPFVKCKPTTDYDAVAFGLEMSPGGGTNITMALSQAFSLSPQPNRIILLSDGHPTCGLSLFNLTIVETAKDLGIKIDTIGIPDADCELLAKIAEMTGGVFFKCTDPEALMQSFLKLETRVRPQLEHKSH